MDDTKLLLFKRETVYATDSNPTAALNAAVTRNFTSKPVVTDRITRNIDRAVRGRSKDAPSNARQTFSYELEMAGSGNAQYEPAWMEHLTCCGMGLPTLAAGGGVVQGFARPGEPLSSGTAYHWRGQQRAVGLGARGTFGFDMTAGAYPFLKLEMTALLPPAVQPVLDGDAPVPVLDRWRDPFEVNTRNTLFTLDGYAAKLKSWTYDTNADVKARNLVGASYVRHGNHAGGGKLVIQAEAIAAKNYFATLLGGQEVNAHAAHGGVPGDIILVDAPRLQIIDIDYQADDDELMLSISYGLNAGPSADDLFFTVG